MTISYSSSTFVGKDLPWKWWLPEKEVQNKICGARGTVNEERNISMQRNYADMVGDKGTEEYNHAPRYCPRIRRAS